MSHFELTVKCANRTSTQVYQELLNQVENDLDLLHRVITGVNPWVYEYDSEAKEQWNRSKSVECEDRVVVYFRLYVFYIEKILLEWKQLIRNTTKVSLGVYSKISERKYLNSGDTRIEFSTVSIWEFLAKSQISLLRQPPILLIYLLPTSACCLNWKFRLKENDLTSLKIFRQKRRSFPMPWKIKFSEMLLKVGTPFSQKGTTLREIYPNSQFRNHRLKTFAWYLIYVIPKEWHNNL